MYINLLPGEVNTEINLGVTLGKINPAYQKVYQVNHTYVFWSSLLNFVDMILQLIINYNTCFYTLIVTFVRTHIKFPVSRGEF